MSNPSGRSPDVSNSTDLSRREFLGTCATHLAMAAAAMPAARRLAWGSSSYGTVVAREPFGSLERIAEGVYALISTPLSGDRTTLSNGGIIAGRNGVLCIEGLNQPAGAAWLAGKAKELTGKWPTHVVLTHYHSDHANGVAGYLTSSDHPVIHATTRTRELVIERNKPVEDARTAAVNGALVIPAETSSLDLGEKVVKIVPRGGHTDSDASLELEDPGIVFCGDLFWNAMIPNFVDAVPSKLAKSVRELRKTRDTIYIPGHGPLGRAAEYDRYISMLHEIESAGRAGYTAGKTTAEIAAQFKLSPALGEWVTFSPAFYQRAFDAWFRELAR